MALFEGARAKIQRARAQAHALQADFVGFLKAKNYTIEQVSDVDAGEKSAVFRITRPFPLEWSIIIGEITYNLRSALDHAIYDLTLLETGGPLERTEFPVFEYEGKYFAVDKRGNPTPDSGLYKIRGINDKAKTVVRDLQPFEFRKTHKAGDEPIIALVHELNIIDKHRTLHLCRHSPTMMQTRVVRDIHPIEFTMIPGKLEDGKVLGRWKPVGALDDEVDVEIEIGFDVAFDDTIVQGKPVVTVCESLVKGVDRALYWLERSLT